MKIQNQYIVYLGENKFKGRKKGPQLCIISFNSEDIFLHSMLREVCNLLKKAIYKVDVWHHEVDVSLTSSSLM